MQLEFLVALILAVPVVTAIAIFIWYLNRRRVFRSMKISRHEKKLGASKARVSELLEDIYSETNINGLQQQEIEIER